MVDLRYGTAVLVAALALSGCAGFHGAPPAPQAIALSEADPQFAAYLAKFYRAGATQRMDVRNEFIEARATAVDTQYAGFKRALHQERVSSAVGVDWSTLFLGSLTAVSPSTQVKTVSGALAAMLVGGKASLDKNLYFDRTLPAMLAQMDGRRAEIRNQILNGMQLSALRYSMLHAQADLQAYFDAGTLSGAIAQMTSDATSRQKSAETVLDKRTQPELIDSLKARRFAILVAKDSPTTALFDRCIDLKTDTVASTIIAPIENLFVQHLKPKPKLADILDLAWLAENESLRAELFADAATKKLFENCSPSPD